MESLIYCIEKILHGPIHRLRLLFIMKKVDIEREKLILNRELLREKVEAIDKTEKVNDAVLEWLEEMEKVREEELSELEAAITDRSNWISPDTERMLRLYNGLLDKMKILNSKCVFEAFSNPIPGLEYFSSIDFVCFESTKKLLINLWKHY